jgi:large subunit ribosomal protein L28
MSQLLLNSFKALSLQSSKSVSNTLFATRNISSNRSKRGLYDLKDIRSGNNVPFSLKKTKRKFKPNVFKKRLYSEILDEMIQFHATTSAIRSIDKMGGLDNYLLTSGEDKVKKGSEGWVVRQRILQKIEKSNKLGEPVLKDINLSRAKKEEKYEEKEGKLVDESGNL